MFKELTKAVIGVAVLPIDIAKDVVTLGGAITEEPSATVKRAKHICKNIDKVTK